jgi:hypothetical protein
MPGLIWSCLRPGLRLSLCLSLFLILHSCNPDRYELTDLDLAVYDLPITIQAPDSVVVSVKPYENMRDITLRKDWYDVQVFEFRPSMNDPGVEKINQLSSVKAAPGFRQLLLEEDNGFIFSLQPDSATTHYDFRYIMLVGDKELIFQTGLREQYELEEVKLMYESVKGE